MSILEQLANDLTQYLARAVYARCVECDGALDPDSESPYCAKCGQAVAEYLNDLDEFYRGDHETTWGEL